MEKDRQKEEESLISFRCLWSNYLKSPQEILFLKIVLIYIGHYITKKLNKFLGQSHLPFHMLVDRCEYIP